MAPRTRSAIRILVAALLIAAPAGAAPPVMLTPMLGQWTGEASVHGRAFRLDLHWQSTLGGRFVRLDHRLHAPGMERPVFEAAAYYRGLDSLTVHGEWFDSGGLQRPITLRSGDRAWVSDWGTEATEVGRTIYTLEGDSVLAVRDSVRARSGEWREFGRARLRRVP